MNKKSTKGMTLVEIVISLAIFGVLSVIFLNIFLSSLTLTVRSGQRADMVSEISSSIEQRIADDSFTDSDITTVSTSVAIIYNKDTASESSEAMEGVLVNGDLINDDGQLVQLKYFIPGE